MLLLLLLIQCKISLYLGPVRPVRCFVTPFSHCLHRLRILAYIVYLVPVTGTGSPVIR